MLMPSVIPPVPRGEPDENMEGAGHSVSARPLPCVAERLRNPRREGVSSQALGRLPWFAPFLRRSLRLRPRLLMRTS